MQRSSLVSAAFLCLVTGVVVPLGACSDADADAAATEDASVSPSASGPTTEPTESPADAATEAGPVIATIHDEVPGTAKGSWVLDEKAAFPQDRVPYLRITISKSEWAKMIADMTELAGPFGASSGGGGGGGAPPGRDGGGPGNPPPGGGDGGPGGGGGAGGGGAGGVDLLARDPIYVECTIQTAGQQWSHVGIRFKGNSSLAGTWQRGVWKLPFRMKLDELADAYPEVEDQRFFGFKNLSFANGSADPTMLHEKLAAGVFGRAGLAEPRTAFYRLYVDYGEGLRYFGLYTGVEVPKDRTLLERHFSSKSGNVYKPEGTGATFATWDEASFEKENNEDAADYSDVRALYDALHASRSDAAAFRAGVDAALDVPTFLTWLATNTAIQDWDQYGQMAHNYYLYADPAKANRLVWIPWDHSYAFSASGSRDLSLGLSEVGAAWPLIRYLADDPVYYASYRDALRTTVLPLLGTGLESDIRAAAALVRPYTVGQYGEVDGYRFTTSAAQFDAAVDGMVSHVASRRAAVTTFLSQ